MAKLLPRWIWCLLVLSAPLRAADKPIWLASNGFHTSLGLRTTDVPFARQIGGARGEDELLIGWGAYEFYQGKANSGTLLQSIFAGPSVLHVVPVHGPIARRFPHSDVFRLRLSPSEFAVLLQQVDAAFARNASGHLIPTGRPGYYPDSHFFRGAERFYFPKMCNFWIAANLQRSGLPLKSAEAITAADLLHQVQRIGRREGTVKLPHDTY